MPLLTVTDKSFVILRASSSILLSLFYYKHLRVDLFSVCFHVNLSVMTVKCLLDARSQSS